MSGFHIPLWGCYICDLDDALRDPPILPDFRFFPVCILVLPEGFVWEETEWDWDTQPYLNQERAVLIVGKFDQGYMYFIDKWTGDKTYESHVFNFQPDMCIGVGLRH